MQSKGSAIFGSQSTSTSFTTNVARRELDAIYSEQQISRTLRIVVPLFLGMVAIMIAVSCINLLICRGTVSTVTIESSYVQDAYTRVVLTAQARSLVRSLLNIANELEPNTSDLTSDRFQLSRAKLNKTVEDIREVQSRLFWADF